MKTKAFIKEDKEMLNIVQAIIKGIVAIFVEFPMFIMGTGLVIALIGLIAAIVAAVWFMKR